MLYGLYDPAMALSHTLTHYAARAWQQIIDLLLPPRCPVTGELVSTHGTVHASFWSALNFIQKPLCDCCGLPFSTPEPDGTLCGFCLSDPPPFSKGRSALYYDSVSARLILPFKHGDRTLLSPLLAQWLVHSGGDILQDADYLIPVPLHRWRLLKRRYNQAAELARAVSTKTSIPWLAHSLRRVRATKTQGHKNAAARIDNVRNAFMVMPHDAALLKNKKVVLIDDVYTTGATVKACCKALHKAGVKEIGVLTLARVAKAN